MLFLELTSLFAQLYTLEQSKRGLCLYDDKRYLLADLPDGQPNPNTHAYGHRDLVGEEQFWQTCQLDLALS